MKQKLLTKLLFLLLCTLWGASFSPAWAEDVSTTYTFTSKAWADESNSWTSNKDGYQSAASGVQVTSNASYTGAGATSKESFSNIKSITVNACTTAKGVGNITVKVGTGSAQTICSLSKQSTPTDYTLNYATPVSGTITFVVNCSTNSMYMKSIKVTTESGSTTYTVTYDGNGATSGDVPEDANEYDKDAEVTVLGNTGNLAKTGYSFGGWNTQADGTGTTYAADNTFTISANTTLYAKWNPYTITAQSSNNTYGTVSLDGYVITASPAEGYRYASPAYTVSSGTATVEQNGDEFTVTPSSDCTVTINFEAIPSYAVTINSVTGGTLTVMNGESAVSDGDEILDGTVLTITATPDDGHNFKNWQAIDASTHTYTASNTGTYTINGRGVTFNANFAAKVYHNAIFKITGGSTYDTKTTEVGQPIDFASVSDPEDSEGRVFVGWVAEEINSTTDSEPTFVTSANMGNEDVTYYACYAYCTPGSTATKTDELTLTTTGVSGTNYKDFSNKSASNSGHSDAVYKGNCAGGNDAIQLRTTNYSGIITTTSGGRAKKVTVTWESHTQVNRTIGVYGKNSAYEAADDLFASGVSTPGTMIGSIVYGTSTELEITGDYTYIGLRSSSGAMYLEEIDIDWETGTPDTYSGYCTTVPEDARTAVNIESFTATNTTLVIGGSPSTTATAVTNDQDGWTESYIYTSDNTSVATVSDEGVITAVAKGKANITVTLDIPKTGGSYKKGSTSSKSIEITVTKPFHTVTFMANGSEVSSTSVEEDDEIVIPDNPANVGNFSFQGWKADSAIDGTQSSAPSYATISTMGNADVTYYAVYAVEKDVTATFDASDISNLTNTATRTWRHNTTGLVLFLSAGQHYTSGTPNTFTVSKGTSNYFQITAPTGGILTNVVAEISESTYKINSVSSGASISTNSTTQTVTFTNDLNSVKCYATSGNQIRAMTIDVDATLYESFCTTIPAYSVTVGDAGYTTYVAANNVSFPVGATAYIATAVNTNTIHLEEVLAVPTGEAVVVKAAAGTYNLTVEASGDCDDVSDNLLLASDGNVTGGEGIYALAKKSDVVGFYLVDSKVTIPAGKAYLNLSGSTVKGFTFEFEDDADDIKTLSDSPLKGENIYNLAGQRISKMQKGINIVNGKKIAIK